MKITKAEIAAKSIKGVFPYEFTYEDGSKGIYLPDNIIEYQWETSGKGGKKAILTSFKPAKEVYEAITGLLGTNTSTQTFK